MLKLPTSCEAWKQLLPHPIFWFQIDKENSDPAIGASVFIIYVSLENCSTF